MSSAVQQPASRKQNVLRELVDILNSKETGHPGSASQRRSGQTNPLSKPNSAQARDSWAGRSVVQVPQMNETQSALEFKNKPTAAAATANAKRSTASRKTGGPVSNYRQSHLRPKTMSRVPKAESSSKIEGGARQTTTTDSSNRIEGGSANDVSNRLEGTYAKPKDAANNDANDSAPGAAEKQNQLPESWYSSKLRLLKNKNMKAESAPKYASRFEEAKMSGLKATMLRKNRKIKKSSSKKSSIGSESDHGFAPLQILSRSNSIISNSAADDLLSDRPVGKTARNEDLDEEAVDTIDEVDDRERASPIMRATEKSVVEENQSNRLRPIEAIDNERASVSMTRQNSVVAKSATYETKLPIMVRPLRLNARYNGGQADDKNSIRQNASSNNLPHYEDSRKVGNAPINSASLVFPKSDSDSNGTPSTVRNSPVPFSPRKLEDRSPSPTAKPPSHVREIKNDASRPKVDQVDEGISDLKEPINTVSHKRATLSKHNLEKPILTKVQKVINMVEVKDASELYSADENTGENTLRENSTVPNSDSFAKRERTHRRKNHPKKRSSISDILEININDDLISYKSYKSYDTNKGSKKYSRSCTRNSRRDPYKYVTSEQLNLLVAKAIQPRISNKSAIASSIDLKETYNLNDSVTSCNGTNPLKPSCSATSKSPAQSHRITSENVIEYSDFCSTQAKKYSVTKLLALFPNKYRNLNRSSKSASTTSLTAIYTDGTTERCNIGVETSTKSVTSVMSVKFDRDLLVQIKNSQQDVDDGTAVETNANSNDESTSVKENKLKKVHSYTQTRKKKKKKAKICENEKQEVSRDSPKERVDDFKIKNGLSNGILKYDKKKPIRFSLLNSQQVTSSVMPINFGNTLDSPKTNIKFSEWKKKYNYDADINISSDKNRQVNNPVSPTDDLHEDSQTAEDNQTVPQLQLNQYQPQTHQTALSSSNSGAYSTIKTLNLGHNATSIWSKRFSSIRPKPSLDITETTIPIHNVTPTYQRRIPMNNLDNAICYSCNGNSCSFNNNPIGNNSSGNNQQLVSNQMDNSNITKSYSPRDNTNSKLIEAEFRKILDARLEEAQNDEYSSRWPSSHKNSTMLFANDKTFQSAERPYTTKDNFYSGASVSPYFDNQNLTNLNFDLEI